MLETTGDEINVHLAPLAGLVEGDDGTESLKTLVREYETWIAEIEKEASSLEEESKKAPRTWINVGPHWRE